MLTLRIPSVDFWEKNAPRAFELADDDPVLRSWHRAATLGVRPDGDAPPEGVDGQALVSLRAELDEVCSVGARLLDPIAQELSRRNMVALLTDRQGTILMARGGGTFSKSAARTRLVEGARWGEQARGTNAIGTAIALRCPVAVVGRAHFERVNHGLFCYAVPIWGVDGDVLAVIDVTGKLEDEDPFAELAVTSFAYRLEHALQARDGAQDTARQRPPPGSPLGERRTVLRTSRSVPSSRPARPARPAPMTDARSRSDSSDRSLASETSVRSVPSSALAGPCNPDPFATILGEDPATQEAKALARRVAKSDLPVMLLAETGTGKELMARAIHLASERRDEPFVPINCGAITPSLLESELFGYAPGAFTGALSAGHVGKVGAAKGGTLFLDEVAEMPAALQATLLRLLDDGAYYRVGENRPRDADVRLICATCRDLPAMVRSGTFRSDLFFRIKGAAISLPPVRAREDRVALARGLLEAMAAKRKFPCPALSPASETLILRALWPGNVRELKTALHHALVLAGDAVVLEPGHFPADLLEAGRTDEHGPREANVGPRTRTLAERGAVEQALRLAAGNLSDAARRLGVARSTLYRLVERHGLTGRAKADHAKSV